jgi:hypothetical protein
MMRKPERGCERAVDLRRAPVGTGVTVPEGIGEVRNNFLLRNNVFITLGQYVADVRGYWEMVTRSVSSSRTRMGDRRYARLRTSLDWITSNSFLI